MAEACRALDFPVVSGNVSLYNETKNEDGSSLAILPTPAIGGVGLLEDWEKSAPIGFKAEGDRLWSASGKLRLDHLGQSLWLRECLGLGEGSPPPVDLDAERRTGEFVRAAIERGLVNAVHDVSDGGLLVAVAEMALAGNLGIDVDGLRCLGGIGLTAELFSEEQGQYLLATSDAEGLELQKLAEEFGVLIGYVGFIGGDTISIGDMPGTSGNFGEIPLADLRAAHEGFFPRLMGRELTPEF
jgi:phosphoribosylformylglycinamidine synthase